MADFITGEAYDWLIKNPEWLTDAKANVPLGERTSCGRWLSTRWGKAPEYAEECVKSALDIIEKEQALTV